MNMDVAATKAESATDKSDMARFIAMRVEGQLFGLSVFEVMDVIKAPVINSVALCPPEVMGLMNLRGRIATAIDTRKLLGLPDKFKSDKKMHVIVECEGEAYSLAVDEVCDVLELPKADFDNVPANLSANWARVAKGVYALEKELMLVLDAKLLLAV